jgi:hypothetical protein
LNEREASHDPRGIEARKKFFKFVQKISSNSFKKIFNLMRREITEDIQVVFIDRKS